AGLCEIRRSAVRVLYAWPDYGYHGNAGETTREAINHYGNSSRTGGKSLSLHGVSDDCKYSSGLRENEVKGYPALMNPLMILVKIIKLRWIHILSYDQMVSRKINNQTTRCANSIFYTTLFTNSAPNYT